MPLGGLAICSLIRQGVNPAHAQCAKKYRDPDEVIIYSIIAEHYILKNGVQS